MMKKLVKSYAFSLVETIGSHIVLVAANLLRLSGTALIINIYLFS
jgi:hypothetical protein